MRELLEQVKTDPDRPIANVLTGIRVLFADESEETIKVFKRVITSLGWDGIYVNNAVDMINTVNNLLSKDLTLDAVVADINYFTGPRVTGITAAREIRKAMPNVPIVFISAYVTSIVKEEIRRVNAEYFAKPFDIETLFIRLSHLIYWNKITTSKEFTGLDKRKASINRSNHLRRATDYILSTPQRIKQSLEEKGAKSYERG